jgi:hypothetical protein
MKEGGWDRSVDGECSAPTTPTMPMPMDRRREYCRAAVVGGVNNARMRERRAGGRRDAYRIADGLFGEEEGVADLNTGITA